MNVLNFPSFNTPLKSNGQLKDEYFNFFSMNNQEQQLYFSQDGHLVPTRTGSELTALSTTQYTARYAYNGTTNNNMVNTNGLYENLTTNQITTRANIVSMTPTPDRIQQYADENGLLYTNVNGSTQQNLTVPVTYPVSITSDGTNLFVNNNGVNYQFNLTPV